MEGQPFRSFVRRGLGDMYVCQVILAFGMPPFRRRLTRVHDRRGVGKEVDDAT